MTDMQAVMTKDNRAFTYAQHYGGNKLHYVEFWSTGQISRKALCGFAISDHWRMTINVPLGHACRNCQRLARRRNAAE